MSRVKGGTVTHARHKKIVKQAKGYYGRRKNTFKVAAQAVAGRAGPDAARRERGTRPAARGWRSSRRCVA